MVWKFGSPQCVEILTSEDHGSNRRWGLWEGISSWRRIPCECYQGLNKETSLSSPAVSTTGGHQPWPRKRPSPEHNSAVTLTSHSSLQNCAKQISVVQKFPSLWHIVTAIRTDWDNYLSEMSHNHLHFFRSFLASCFVLKKKIQY